MPPFLCILYGLLYDATVQKICYFMKFLISLLPLTFMGPQTEEPLCCHMTKTVAGLASLISCLAEWQHNFACSPRGEGITVNKMNQKLNGSISFSAVCLDCLFLYSWAHSYLLAAVSQNARSAKLYEVIS